MARWSYGHIGFDSSGVLIKYSRIGVTEICYSVNIFVRVVELLIKRNAKYMEP